jgi:RNA polymerase II subunit A C-terminal domain phosphatase SSU72
LLIGVAIQKVAAMAQSRLSFACVCASNVNRSMAAHQTLMRNGYAVASYGTNSHISLPGPRERGNNIFDFGTTYAEILANLEEQGHPLYTSLGLIEMIQRDQSIKEKPERFLATFDQRRYFDVIFTYERPILEKVVAEFQANGSATFQLCHVINIETPDDSAHALASAGTTLALARDLSALPSITDGIEDTLQAKDKKGEFAYHIVSY